ncbi:hypothetical protein [Conexibacter arvalis]|uniref:Lipoprotein n=1 Tax=Conexibacter arvalis TaxID=912552 RepID=A0A840I9P3_9ACTN|nr:hypothetical protein [Conexibacter arvalis]MBB4661637.1 hypothetical protein [Conexibacter arvalis]
MARRALPLLLIAALAIGGCASGTPADLDADQKQARVELLRAAGEFDDHELARFCPGLYPRDFLTNEDDYPREDEDHRNPRITPELRALAGQAGCDVPSPE